MTQPGEDLHELDAVTLDPSRDVEAPEADAYEQRLPANPADAHDDDQVVDLDDDYR